MTCRACGRAFAGGVIPEEIEISPEVDTAEPSRPHRRRLRLGPRARATLARGLALVLPAVPLAGWYATLWRAPVFWFGVNYACLVVAWAAVALLAWRLRPSRLAPAAALCAVLCAASIALNAWHDRYEREWGEGGITYRDTRGRWNPRWNHRFMRGDDAAPFGTKQGPMSASWKPHGRWRVFLGERVPFDVSVRDEWYWEGEPVTKGKWEARGGAPAGDYRPRRW